jgi:hypothetical protein
MTLGDTGERLDLRIRQGGDFEALSLTLTNADGTAVDTSNCTSVAWAKHRATGTKVALPTALIDGKFTMTVPHVTSAALKCGANERSADSVHDWQWDVIDAGGKVFPQYYGTVLVTPDRGAE